MGIVLAKVSTAIFGEEFEVLIDWVATIVFGVVVGAVVFFALLILLARIDFEVSRMVLLLLPSMAMLATILVWASV